MFRALVSQVVNANPNLAATIGSELTDRLKKLQQGEQDLKVRQEASSTELLTRSRSLEAEFEKKENELKERKMQVKRLEEETKRKEASLREVEEKLMKLQIENAGRDQALREREEVIKLAEAQLALAQEASVMKQRQSNPEHDDLIKNLYKYHETLKSLESNPLLALEEHSDADDERLIRQILMYQRAFATEEEQTQLLQRQIKGYQESEEANLARIAELEDAVELAAHQFTVKEAAVGTLSEELEKARSRLSDRDEMVRTQTERIGVLESTLRNCEKKLLAIQEDNLMVRKKLEIIFKVSQL